MVGGQATHGTFFHSGTVAVRTGLATEPGRKAPHGTTSYTSVQHGKRRDRRRTMVPGA